MNDSDRAALVDGIARRIDNFCEHVGYGDRDVTRDEAESYVAEIEEALTTRTVPTVDDDAVEAAAKALYEYDANRDSHRIPFMPWGAQAGPRMDEIRREFRVQAHVAIAAVRTHDAQATATQEGTRR